MTDRRIWSTERAAGYFFVLGFVTCVAGAVMYTIRGGPSGGIPPSYTFFVFERSFFIAAVIATVIGVVLLEGYLNNTDGRVLARTGATTYLFAGIMLVAAEALFLSPGFGPSFEKRGYALIVVCVVLAFLAQALIGGALLQSGLLAAWIGWATIVWSLGSLVVLVVIMSGDLYIPIMHEIMPLLIGTALLWRRS